MSLSFDPSKLESGINSLMSRAEMAVGLYAETAAIKLQNHMRKDAPWTDRTGHARQRLQAYSRKVTGGHRITLAQGVEYGVFLELAHEKRFAIIQPTILSKSGEVMEGLNRLLERLG